MLGSIKSFITGMVQSEEQFIRFKQMGSEDSKQLMELVQLDIQISKKRQAIGYEKNGGPIKVVEDDVISKLEQDLNEIDGGPEEINLDNA